MGKLYESMWVAVLVVVVLLLVCWYKKETFINKKRTVIFYHVDWCPYCTSAKPIWSLLKSDLGPAFTFEDINETGIDAPTVNKYPTVRMVDEHGRMSEYRGVFEFKSLRDWITRPNTY